MDLENSTSELMAIMTQDLDYYKVIQNTLMEIARLRQDLTKLLLENASDEKVDIVRKELDDKKKWLNASLAANPKRNGS